MSNVQRSLRSFVLGSALVAGAAMADPPTLVSPAGETTACPTFSWAETVEASGYELVIYAVSGTGDVSPLPVTKVALPAGASSWTLPADACLAPGGRYAWSLRVVAAENDTEWATPVLLSIRAMPSEDEVKEALDVLQRYREGTVDQRSVEEGLAPSRPPEAGLAGLEPQALAESPSNEESTVADIAPTSSGVLAPNPATEPQSLSIDSSIALGSASNLFKDGKLLLWTDSTSATTAIGEGALASTNADSANDTAVGYRALANSTGDPSLKSRNTAIGAYALEDNTTGFRNTATGRMALRNNTTGHSNTADGELALYSNLDGRYNTAFGNKALFSHVGEGEGFDDGNGNTAVGALALHLNLDGGSNTAIGFRALASNTSQARNTALGALSLENNTTGFRNTAIGFRAMQFHSSGKGNTAVGYDALQDDIVSNYNTALGFGALSSAFGGANTGIGTFTLSGPGSGSGNTAIGHSALNDWESGNGNTAVGSGAGSNWTTGSNNIAIGSGAFGMSGETGVIRIGGLNRQTKTYIEGIGFTTVSGSQVFINGDQLGIAASSARFKHDVHDLRGASGRLLNLRPVTFRYKEEFVDAEPAPLEYGLIAEEVAEVFPELVISDEDGEPFTVRYHLLVPLLLSEFQRQERILDAQAANLSARDEQIAELQRQVAVLHRRTEKLLRKRDFRD